MSAYVPRHSVTTDQQVRAEQVRANTLAAAHAAQGKTGYAEFVLTLSALRIARLQTNQRNTP